VSMILVFADVKYLSETGFPALLFLLMWVNLKIRYCNMND